MAGKNVCYANIPDTIDHSMEIQQMHDDFQKSHLATSTSTKDKDFFDTDNELDSSIARTSIKRGREAAELQGQIDETSTKKSLIETQGPTDNNLRDPGYQNKEMNSQEKETNYGIDLRNLPTTSKGLRNVATGRTITLQAGGSSDRRDKIQKEQWHSNATMNSLGLEKVLLIKPALEDKQQFFHNPIEIAKAIKASLFGSVSEKVKEIRTNHTKGVIAVELKEKDSLLMQKLLGIKQLGKWKVSCYMPNSDIYKLGVISPISTDVELEEIKEHMVVGEANQVIKIDRLQKRTPNGWIPSTALKITFSGDRLPENVKISHCNYKVRPFVGLPMQCYKCQRLGHTAGSCNSTQNKCMICAGPHDKAQCNSRKHKCANCGQQHTANSRECHLIIKARKIESLKAKSGLSHRDATEQVLKRGHMNINAEHVLPVIEEGISPSPIIGKSRYSEILKRKTRNADIAARSVAVQTDITGEICAAENLAYNCSPENEMGNGMRMNSKIEHNTTSRAIPTNQSLQKSQIKVADEQLMVKVKELVINTLKELNIMKEIDKENNASKDLNVVHPTCSIREELGNTQITQNVKRNEGCLVISRTHNISESSDGSIEEMAVLSPGCRSKSRDKNNSSKTNKSAEANTKTDAKVSQSKYGRGRKAKNKLNNAQ